MCRKRCAPQRTWRCKITSSVGRRDSGISSISLTPPLTPNRQDVPARKHLPRAISPTRISLKETKYPAAYFIPGQCALLDMPNPHGYTLGERMRRAKGARRALLIAEERQHKARWFYLSFATGYAFLGAAIVRGHAFLTAIQRASDLNINPGGGVMSRALNWRHMKRIPADRSIATPSDYIDKGPKVY